VLPQDFVAFGLELKTVQYPEHGVLRYSFSAADTSLALLFFWEGFTSKLSMPVGLQGRGKPNGLRASHRPGAFAVIHQRIVINRHRFLSPPPIGSG